MNVPNTKIYLRLLSVFIVILFINSCVNENGKKSTTFSAKTNNTPGGFNQNDFHIYLLIGQSNMAGRGEIGIEDEAVLKNVYLYNSTSNWERAENPLNKYSTVRKDIEFQKMNLGYTFARKLSEYTNKGIGLVVNARGGTSIEQWQKGYGGSNDYDLYEEALSQLTQAKKDGNFKGIIWHQGESNQNSSSTYLSKLKKLVKDIRRDTGEDVYFVAGELGKWRESSKEINRIIGNIPNEIDNAGFVLSDGLIPLNNDTTDPHFDGPSLRILGQLYANNILKNIYDIPAGVVSFYSECDYAGYKVKLKEGSYDLKELEKRGIKEDIASVKLNEGYQMIITKRNSESEICIKESNSCLDVAIWENISNIQIRK